MTNKNKAFQATEFVRTIDTTREVTPFNGDMAICLEEGIVIITKQQAMDFWGLVNQGVNIKSKDIDDNIDQEKCPAINGYCKHYCYQHDINGEVVIEHCSHGQNKEDVEGNCRESLCPILVKNN